MTLYWPPDPSVFDEITQAGRDAIGEGLKRARRHRGLSQHQAAWRSGLSQSAISRLENGKLLGLRFRRLCVLAAVLGVGGDFILPYALKPEPPPPTRRLPRMQPGP
jgi:transcriptional regulator with XRE-family HTH domain